MSANKQNQDMIAGCIWLPGTLKEGYSIKPTGSEISLDDNALSESWRLSRYQQGSVVKEVETFKVIDMIENQIIINYDSKKCK